MFNSIFLDLHCLTQYCRASIFTRILHSIRLHVTCRTSLSQCKSMFKYIVTNRLLHSERARDKPPYAADDCQSQGDLCRQSPWMNQIIFPRLINGSAEHFTFWWFNIWLRFPAAAYCYHGNADIEIVGGGD